MSFFDVLKKVALAPATLIHKVEDVGTDLYHRVTGTPTAEEKRNQQGAINAQIQAYKNQTEIAQQQINEAKAQNDVTRRQVNEKQIRALRNTYRPSAGFLAPQNLTNVQPVNTKLGG